jgi:hypothetical protein
MKTILIYLIAALTLFTACSAPNATAKDVKRETANQRKSPIVLSAKLGDQYFHLRQENFFDYLEGKELYAGTYTQKGDSLLLGFHNNYHPADLTGKAFVDRTGGVLILLSKDISRHRRLAIIP